MSQKIIIAGGVVVLAILALFMFLGFSKKNEVSDQSVSPNILYITSPVTFLSGKVEKVEGNTILVSNQYAVPQTAPIVITVLPNQPPIMPTPQTKTITYKLLVTDKTQINQPATYVNYLLRTVVPSPQAKLTVKDIKVGQMITVNSAVDLRILKSNELEATMINLPQTTKVLSGKIVSVTNNALTLKAFPPLTGGPVAVNTAPAAPQEKEYFITVTSDTEISRMTSGGSSTLPKPEKLALSDLKKDMQTTVYTAEDVTEAQTFTALRIEPAQVISTAAPLIPEANVLISPTLSPAPSASTSPSIEP